MRANGVRDSLLTGDPDDMSEIGDMQNILELHISDASVFVSFEKDHQSHVVLMHIGN
jgi:hypothetical protein